jgi:hypothetical protein
LEPRRPLMQMPAPHRCEDAAERREGYGDNGDCVKLNEMVHVPPSVIVIGVPQQPPNVNWLTN